MATAAAVAYMFFACLLLLCTHYSLTFPEFTLMNAVSCIVGLLPAYLLCFVLLVLALFLPL
jgi:hypothetical protein